MTAVAWWTLGTAVFVMAAVAMSAGFRLGPVRWAGDALARRREAELRAEKLLLESDEQRFLATARHHQLVGQHLVCGGHPRYGLDAVGTPGDIQARDLPRADPVAIAAARHDVEPPTRAVLVTLAG